MVRNIKLNPINDEIINEVLSELEYINNIKNNFPSKTSFSKYKGNVISYIITKYIQGILDKHSLEYKVSEVNSYIKGFPVEWDLLIVRKNSKEYFNIYDPSDVVAAIEFKTSGSPNVKLIDLEDFFKERHDKYFEIINNISKIANHKIPYIYISFSYWPNYYEAVKEYFNSKNNIKNIDTAFVFLNDQQSSKRKNIMDDYSDFEKFIVSIVKNR